MRWGSRANGPGARNDIIRRIFGIRFAELLPVLDIRGEPLSHSAERDHHSAHPLLQPHHRAASCALRGPFGLLAEKQGQSPGGLDGCRRRRMVPLV
jgi:hypothetical protein